ncbi:MAG: ferrous iron transport protein A, partial [Clostridia bacterium]|nr:ferrous iron transport protein A [Clostridia bacterium]
MKLDKLKVGESAVITKVGGEGSLRQHFLDMGVIPDTEVTLIKFAPMGDPMELSIHGYELTLRLADAHKITVRPIEKKENGEATKSEVIKTVHPGYGEDGKYHVKADENPVPKG